MSNPKRLTTPHAPTERLAVLPRRVASEVIAAAVVRGGRGVGVVQLLLAVPVLVDVYASLGIAERAVLPSAIALVLAALKLVALLKPLRALAIVADASVLLGSIAWVLLLVHDVPHAVTDGQYLLNRVPLVLIFCGPPSRRIALALLWSTGGLIGCLGVLAVADAVAGVAYRPGAGPVLSWLVYASALFIVGFARARSESGVADIARLERETRRRALESQFEQRAAAMIHDTVLGDLTAIMNAGPELDDRARERFRADVALLKAPTWLDSSALELDVEDAQLRNGTVALASEMQWRGLTVDVTGENDAVVPLTAEARAAVHEALRECLENVLRHSGETSAELVVGGDSNEVTYMVIDRGVGFDPDTVGVEHLGIRSSIVGRIEQVGGSVRIWSRHGSGTSVLISVPVGGDA